MYTLRRTRETFRERQCKKGEEKERTNSYKKSKSKHWQLYKMIQNLKKNSNILWGKQKARKIPVCKNERMFKIQSPKYASYYMRS